MNQATALSAILIAPEGSEYIALVQRGTSSLRLLPYAQGADQSNCHLILLLIHADRGLSQSEITGFNRLREKQIPALILIASLMPSAPSHSPASQSDSITSLAADDRWDFDDVVMLINRTLETVIAPFLVLHDDAGAPIGLYDLAQESVIDYSSGTAIADLPDLELQELVSEFKEEFDDENFDAADFTSGLRVVALPYIPERGIGTTEINRFLTMLQQVQP